MQAGDDDRAAITFIGLEGGPGKNETLFRTNGIYNCDDNQEQLVWNYYAAVTYDAGQTWAVHRLNDPADPVQVGGIYDVVVDGSGGCRNLLDFQDMDIDSKGRIHVGWADGCTRQCAATKAPPGEGANLEGYRDRGAKVFRQVGGHGLFAEFDTEPLPSGPILDIDRDGIANQDDDDIDGDGLLNQDDGDIDGDGVANDADADDNGDGIDDTSQPDLVIPGLEDDEAEAPMLGLVPVLVTLALVALIRRRR